MFFGRPNLRTVIVVTVLAALAWALAESQTLQTSTISVQVVLADRSEGDATRSEGLVVRAAPGQGWDGTAEVTIAGSAALIDELADRLVGRATLTVGPDFPSEPGTHEVDLREALRGSESFRDAGVTIESVSPARVEVQVGQLGAREFPVRVSVPEGVELLAAPTASPAVVRVVAPESVLNEIENGLAVEATLTDRELGPLVPGREEVVAGVRVAAPADVRGGWPVRVDPARVDIRVQLRSKAASLTVPTMPVQILLAPSELGRWTITVEPADQDLVDVVLTGPQEQLDRIGRGEVRPVAVVGLSFAELEAGVESARARIYGLPAGVRAEIARDEVRVRIERAAVEGPDPASP
ncbi:MAG: hypothetical protein DHS20C14_01320 [Phycisphaeraceae bacterium]|nr:MAG: hypothetical protein DHS20C14_01320 [Phycisphaeraceae bacterium]